MNWCSVSTTETERNPLFDKILKHMGHPIECVYYGESDCPANVAVECLLCNEVIVDCDADGDADQQGSDNGLSVVYRYYAPGQRTRSELTRYYDRATDAVVPRVGEVVELGERPNTVAVLVATVRWHPDLRRVDIVGAR